MVKTVLLLKQKIDFSSETDEGGEGREMGHSFTTCNILL